MMLWNRRFERLSFNIKRGEHNRGKHSSAHSDTQDTPQNRGKMERIPDLGPAIPGIGAFYWISQNLPQQVEDLFFNTLTMLQRYS